MTGRTDLESLVYQMNMDLSRSLKAQDKLIARVEQDSKKVVAHSEKMGNALEKCFERPNIGKAMDKIFDRSRLAVFEEGAVKIPVFGSALEALGGAGFAAAGGLAAMGLSLEQTHKAMEFAKDIGDTANRLHFGTGPLQEWRLLAQEAGADAKAADTAIEAFQVKLGAAESKYSKRAMKPFAQLGLTADDLKGFKTTDEAMTAVIGKVAALSNEAERAHIMEKLGLGPLAGVVRMGNDRIEEMKAEFKSMGLIMDEHMVREGQKAAHQFELVSKAIDMDMKNAFLSLAPVLIYLARLVKALADGLDGMVEGFSRVEKRSSSFLQRQSDAARDDIERIERSQRRQANGKFAPDAQRIYDTAWATINRNSALIGSREQADKVAAPSGGTDLAPGDTKKGPDLAKKAAEEQKRFDGEMARLREQQLHATDNDLASASARAAISLRLLDMERLDALKKIEDQVATKEIAEAHGRLLTYTTQWLFLTKGQVLEAENEKKVQNAYGAVVHGLSEADAALLKSKAALARTVRERAELEAHALGIEQIVARQKLQDEFDRNPNMLPAERAARLSSLSGEQANARESQRRANLGPIDGLMDSAPKSLEELNDRARHAAADGIKSLNQGLIETIAHGGKAGDVIRQVLQRFFIEMAQQALLAAEAKAGVSAGLHMLGFAAGGRPPVGQPVIVGEHRPEIFVPDVAGTVVPSFQMANAMGSRGGVTYVTNHYSLQGSILANDVFDAIRQGDAHTARSTYARSMQSFDQLAPGRNQKYQQLGT